MAEVKRRLNKKSPTPVDFTVLWKAVNAVIGSKTEPPKTIAELNASSDSVSFYVRNIVTGLKATRILYDNNLFYHDRENAFLYLMDVIPLLKLGDFPADEEEAEDFCRKFAFSPVNSGGTEFQSLFSRICRNNCGSRKLPDRYGRFPVQVLIEDWEVLYPDTSIFERFGPLVEDFLSNY